MSELINNREYRQKQLKILIKQLHDGKTVDEVKDAFADLIKDVSAIEITEMETALVQEGMPIEEIQRLCDVHAEVFKGTIEEIHRPLRLDEIKGHPLHTFTIENRAIENLIDGDIKKDLESFMLNPEDITRYKLIEDLNMLWDIDKHYSRKENLLFPFMEKYEITAPPKVMWGVDDEIRAQLKEVKSLLTNFNGGQEIIREKLNELTKKIVDMIFKEESILFPMVTDILSEDEWRIIEEDSDEIGYCLTEPKGKWKPVNKNVEKIETDKGEPIAEKGYIKFETGLLSTREIGALLNTLPLDITFVDKNGIVKYFSQGKERIFARTKSVIGREVSNCHPPASVHIVEKIVEDLMSGKKDHEDFWIKMGNTFAYIRYFAVRDEEGEYLGTLEVTQNISPILELEGEKRLVSE